MSIAFHGSQATPEEKISLAALVSRAQSGCPGALERLIDATRRRLLRFCVFLTKDLALAEDICQETFVKVLQALGSVKDPGSFQTWLLRSARNVFLDYVKSRSHRLMALDDKDLLRYLEANDYQVTRDIHFTLVALRPSDRVVLLLVDLQGYSYREAAEILSISLPALRSRLARARKAFEDGYI